MISNIRKLQFENETALYSNEAAQQKPFGVELPAQKKNKNFLYCTFERSGL